MAKKAKEKVIEITAEKLEKLYESVSGEYQSQFSEEFNNKLQSFKS